MDDFEKILVPVDLSDQCEPAIKLATKLAKCHNAKLVFCYVALPPLPPEALYFKNDLNTVILREHAEFKQIVPPDLSIEYQHEFLRGNPGPEIVKLAQESQCDLVVMSSHGRTGFLRWVLGSVAEYVIRHSKCPVLTVKVQSDQPDDQSDSDSDAKNREAKDADELGLEKSDDHLKQDGDFQKSPFVTSAMSHVLPIRQRDEMQDVITELAAANSNAAPVIDDDGKCIGILTETDIQNYLSRWHENREQPKTGDGDQPKPDKTFHQVKMHMSSPVVTIATSATCRDAQQMFDDHSDIHHLIVTTDDGEPIGVLQPEYLLPLNKWDLNQGVSVSP